MLRTLFDRFQTVNKVEIFKQGFPLVGSRFSFYTPDGKVIKYFAKRVYSCPKLPFVEKFQIREYSNWRTKDNNKNEETRSPTRPSYYRSGNYLNDNDKLRPQTGQPQSNRRSLAVGLFEEIKQKSSQIEPLDHLQPSNVSPYDSTCSPCFPSTLKTSSILNKEKVLKKVASLGSLAKNPPRRGYSRFGEDSLRTSDNFHQSLKDRISIHPLSLSKENDIESNRSTSCLRRPWPSYSEVVSIRSGAKSEMSDSHDEGLSRQVSVDIQSAADNISESVSEYKNNIYYRRSKSLWNKENVAKHNERSKVDDDLQSEPKTFLPVLAKTEERTPQESYSEILKALENRTSFNLDDITGGSSINTNIGILSTSPPIMKNLPAVHEKRLLSKQFDHIYNTSTNKAKSIKQYKRNITTSPIFYKKCCKPKNKKRDPCDEPPKKSKKCFLPSKVRLPPHRKCSFAPKPCPQPEPCTRADDFLCKKPKTLPKMEVNDCICHEPYIPTRAPKLKRLKFRAPDPPRVCPKPWCPQPRADDTLQVPRRTLRTLQSKDCDCVEPKPLADVKLKRLVKVCEPEVCNPPKICPKDTCPPRADENWKPKKRRLKVLHPSVCPCIDGIFKDVPPIKRLNLKFPQPPKPCPKPPPCERADDKLVQQPKFLPFLRAKDCPCTETKMVDVNFKRLKCRKYEEPCYPEDPCKGYPARADLGCWEYYIAPKPKEKDPRKLKCKPKKKKCCK